MPLLGAFYFVTFVLFGTMIMLNLVIGVIINGMDEAQKEIADRRIHELLTHGEDGEAVVNREKQVAKLKQQLQQITDELGELT